MSQLWYRLSRIKITHEWEKLEKSLFKYFEESYEYLPFFMNALQSFNHDIYVDWYFKEHDVGDLVIEVIYPPNIYKIVI